MDPNNSSTGAAGERAATRALTARGASVTKAPLSSGYDLLARYPDGLVEHVEVKSGFTLKGGLACSARAKEAVAMAWLSGTPTVVYTSSLPRPGSLSERIMTKALAEGVIVDVRLLSETDFIELEARR